MFDDQVDKPGWKYSPAPGRLLNQSLGLALLVVLGGCVAGNFQSGVLAPVLAVGPTAEDLGVVADASPEIQLDGNADLVLTGADASTGNRPEGTFIAVPSHRPAGEPAADEQQLALVATTSPVAEQKAAAIASGTPRPDASQETTNLANDNQNDQVDAPLAQPATKKPAKSFFASLFKRSQPTLERDQVKKTKPTSDGPSRVVLLQRNFYTDLPGVRTPPSFGINNAIRGGDEGYDPALYLASAGGLARTSANGLRIQHSGVKVSCLKPELVRVIKQVQRRYGRVPVITSGYRSSTRNRQVRGARNSTHITCRAADIQVAGVSKWALAKYLRSMPGRGGVGTYCHTKSVHIDIGPKRDWNWRCRRGKRKRRAGG